MYIYDNRFISQNINMTYAVTIDTLPNFMIDIAERLKTQKTVLVDYINEEDLHVNSKEFKSTERWKRQTAETSIKDLQKMISKDGNKKIKKVW